jgi:hypothetical protein
MDDKDQTIFELEGNIDRLMALYEASGKRCKILMEENSTLVIQLKEKEKELEQIDYKVQTMRLAKIVALSADDAHEAKLKVNQIVREIDKCIALLNK